jgi:hypothetical protein
VTVWVGPLISLVIVAGTDAWVYVDARRWVAEGSPVFFRVGRLSVDTPAAWLGCCVVLWIVFFPVYLVSRRA